MIGIGFGKKKLRMKQKEDKKKDDKEKRVEFTEAEDNITTYEAVKNTNVNQTYVDKKIEEAKQVLADKKIELEDFKKSIQERASSLQAEVEENAETITRLQNIGNSSMRIYEILEMINDYRGKESGNSDELLDALEEEIINCVLRTRKK